MEYHFFEAIRLFTIKTPTPGIWKATVAGRGDRTYAGDLTTPGMRFRVAMTGIDANSFRFQRVQDQLVDR